MTELLLRPVRGPAGDSVWTPSLYDEVDEPLVCVAVEQLTHDVASFVLRSAHGRAYRFEPGQYLTVTVPVDGQEIERCYTISSSPLCPEVLTITVKRVPGGPVSNWLHDHLRPGIAVPVTGPRGHFSITHHPATQHLFLSAGSGITPLMSMTRAIHDRGCVADVVFVHSARTPDDIVFRGELAEIVATNAGVRVVTVCEEDSPTQRWTGRRGRLTLPMLRSIAPDLAEREVFTCGPPAYMGAVRAMLAEAGPAAERCHEESFTLRSPVHDTATVATSAGSAGTGFSVELRRSGRTISCEPGTTVLEAAGRAGLSLPSSCGEGVCGTCKTRMLSGSVDMDHGGGIRPREIAESLVLLCCSSPRTDLVLDA